MTYLKMSLGELGSIEVEKKVRLLGSSRATIYAVVGLWTPTPACLKHPTYRYLFYDLTPRQVEVVVEYHHASGTYIPYEAYPV